jgi:hypothetical protein
MGRSGDKSSKISLISPYILNCQPRRPFLFSIVLKKLGDKRSAGWAALFMIMPFPYIEAFFKNIDWKEVENRL